MTTTHDLIQSAKRYLQGSGRPEYNRITPAMTTATTDITFDFALGSIQAGAILGVDLEDLYVWTLVGATATVARGWNGSTPAAHSANRTVSVNPLFSNWAVLCEVNNELASISPQIYQVKTVTETMTTASSYNLAADVIDVLAVQYADIGPSTNWPSLHRWSFLPNQDTTVFTSGKALRLYELPDPGRTLRVTYAAPLGTLSDLLENVETVTGLPTSAADIPAIGAAARLLSAREARRSQLDAQPEPRQAADVPPGTARSAAAQLFALRDRRIKEESAKLSRLYPSHIRRAV